MKSDNKTEANPVEITLTGGNTGGNAGGNTNEPVETKNDYPEMVLDMFDLDKHGSDRRYSILSDLVKSHLTLCKAFRDLVAMEDEEEEEYDDSEEDTPENTPVEA